MSEKLTNEEKLDAIYEMTRQNHEVLKTIRRQQYISGAFRTMYWLLVLGAIGGSYYYIKPFISNFMGNSSKIKDSFVQIKGQFPEATLVNQIMDTINKPTSDAKGTTQPVQP